MSEDGISAGMWFVIVAIVIGAILVGIGFLYLLRYFFFHSLVPPTSKKQPRAQNN